MGRGVAALEPRRRAAARKSSWPAPRSQAPLRRPPLWQLSLGAQGEASTRFRSRFKGKLPYEALRIRLSILVIAFFAATDRLTSAWHLSRAVRASAIWAGLPPAFARSNWAIAALERIKRSHIPCNKAPCGQIARRVYFTPVCQSLATFHRAIVGIKLICDRSATL
jgi:hypothetical protein